MMRRVCLIGARDGRWMVVTVRKWKLAGLGLHERLVHMS
jgi:hypothetical protein